MIGMPVIKECPFGGPCIRLEEKDLSSLGKCGLPMPFRVACPKGITGSTSHLQKLFAEKGWKFNPNLVYELVGPNAWILYVAYGSMNRFHPALSVSHSGGLNVHEEDLDKQAKARQTL